MIYHYVRSKDPYGCAIASSAMLAHVGYDVAKAAINPTIHFDNVTTRQLLNGLRTLGCRVKSYVPVVESAESKIDFVNSLQHDAFLTLDAGHGSIYGWTHCVAWCSKRKEIFDPSDNYSDRRYHSPLRYFKGEQWDIYHVIEIVGREVVKTREYSKSVKRQQNQR